MKSARLTIYIARHDDDDGVAGAYHSEFHTAKVAITAEMMMDVDDLRGHGQGIVQIWRRPRT